MAKGISDLGRRLLRKSVADLHDDRECCAACGRTPLVGERVHRYAGEALVCALCRPAHEGEPQRSELVRHSELGNAVKPAARIAA